MVRTIAKFSDSDRQRFAGKLLPTVNGCLVWTGQQLKSGYGVFRFGSKLDGTRQEWLAHRVAWVLAGNLFTAADKPFVLHSCDNPPCCAIEHLWAGNDLDNARDRAIKGRGTRSPNRLPFGAMPNGKRFQSKVIYRRKWIVLGQYDTAAEASAVALAMKAFLHRVYAHRPPAP
jgi:hypothetical protein